MYTFSVYIYVLLFIFIQLHFLRKYVYILIICKFLIIIIHKYLKFKTFIAFEELNL